MNEFEYKSFPETQGVKRVVTERLVLSQIRKEKSVKKVKQELSGSDFAGIYFLINTESMEIYVGETSDMINRIKQHCKNPPVEDFDFDEVVLIWNGRPIETSHFNDDTLREMLEYESIEAFDDFSDYTTVNTVSSPTTMSIYQKSTIDKFKDELLFLLYEDHYIDARPEETKRSEELEPGEIKELLEKNGYSVKNIDRSRKIVSCKKARAFYRSGSLKDKGWQVTLRNKFAKSMFSGSEDVYFLFSRTRAFLIPSKIFEENFKEKKSGVTIDIFVEDKEEKIYCQGEEVNISEYRIN